MVDRGKCFWDRNWLRLSAWKSAVCTGVASCRAFKPVGALTAKPQEVNLVEYRSQHWRDKKHQILSIRLVTSLYIWRQMAGNRYGIYYTPFQREYLRREFIWKSQLVSGMIQYQEGSEIESRKFVSGGWGFIYASITLGGCLLVSKCYFSLLYFWVQLPCFRFTFPHLYSSIFLMGRNLPDMINYMCVRRVAISPSKVKKIIPKAHFIPWGHSKHWGREAKRNELPPKKLVTSQYRVSPFKRSGGKIFKRFNFKSHLNTWDFFREQIL